MNEARTAASHGSSGACRPRARERAGRRDHRRLRRRDRPRSAPAGPDAAGPTPRRPPPRSSPDGDTEVLARIDGAPIWIREGRLDVVARRPGRAGRGGTAARPARGRALAGPAAPGGAAARADRRDRLAAAPAAGHLPARRPEPALALLRLPLAAAARPITPAEHGYHLALAMVPLDARVAHPRAVRLLREQRRDLPLRPRQRPLRRRARTRPASRTRRWPWQRRRCAGSPPSSSAPACRSRG